jgi:hypothetical protein
VSCETFEVVNEVVKEAAEHPDEQQGLWDCRGFIRNVAAIVFF